MPDEAFRFGRLISTTAEMGGFPGSHLVYFYDAKQASKHPIPELSRDAMLVPPLGTNQKPWTLGYFETLEHRPLSESDVLAQHCFRDLRGRCVDERGLLLSTPVEPCGEFALHSYRTIDDLLSDVLGFPQVPDEPE